MAQTMTPNMHLQLAAFFLFVGLCVAGTRLIYHDGVVQNMRRLGMHCKLLAAMILMLASWAYSIGFYLSAEYHSQLNHKDHVIQQLSGQAEGNNQHAQQIAHAVAHKSIEVTTPNGSSVAWTSGNNVSTTGPMLRTAERISGIDSGTRRIDSVGASADNGLDPMRGSEPPKHVF